MLDQYQQEIVDSNEPRIIVEAGAGSGKALLNGSKVVTPNGYINIEDLKVGDEIFGIDGNIYNILGIFPQGEKQIYNVTFSDGTIIKCSKDHLWTFQTRSMRSQYSKKYMTKTLEEIMNNYKITRTDKNGITTKNIYIPLNSALRFHKKDLPIKPYTLGALLGNGLLRTRGNSCSFSSNDSYCINKVNNELAEINYTLKYSSKYDYRLSQIKQHKVSNLITILEQLGIDGKHSWEKFIPQIYLYSDIEDRLELIKGLMDTDGYYKKGMYEYSTTSKQLAEDVKFLAQSLGCTAKITSKITPKYFYNNEERIGRIAYRVYIKCPKEIPIIHSSPKKDNEIKQQCYARKTIIDIQKTDEYGKMTCIKTSAPDELFLTDNFTATHNTYTLIERVKRLLLDGVEPSNMVIITFTRMAAEELKERLIDVPGIGDCFVGTIHAFANKIFQNSDETYKLYSDEIENQFMTVLINLYSKYITMDKFFTYKDIMKKIDLGLKTEMDLDLAITQNEKYEIEVFMGKIENESYPETIKTLCKKHNVITFDELLKKTTEYFKQINGKVEYLFVDEFQDIGKLERDFFKALNADNYFYVGDEKQRNLQL